MKRNPGGQWWLSSMISSLVLFDSASSNSTNSSTKDGKKEKQLGGTERWQRLWRSAATVGLTTGARNLKHEEWAEPWDSGGNRRRKWSGIRGMKCSKEGNTDERGLRGGGWVDLPEMWSRPNKGRYTQRITKKRDSWLASLTTLFSNNSSVCIPVCVCMCVCVSVNLIYICFNCKWMEWKSFMKTRRKFFFFFSSWSRKKTFFHLSFWWFFFCVALFGGAGRRIGEWTTPTSDVGVEWDVEMWSLHETGHNGN